MKAIVIFLLAASGLRAGACSGIDVGSSLDGKLSWHGFVAGSASSGYRQNITNALVDPHSATWLANTGGAHGTFFPLSPTLFPDQGWSGHFVHYVHGNTQRRIAIRDNPTWSKTAFTGSMNASSAILTVASWQTVQGRQTPYFSQSDVGLSISVSGVCSGNHGQCVNGVLGGNPGGVTIVSVNGPTQATLSVAADNTVSGNALVNVLYREGYPTDSDPGTFPLPLAPRIQTWYGPHSRPFGTFLDRFLDPNTGGQNMPSDQHVYIVDVDNCIEYDLWNVYDDGSNISAGTYAAYWLPGGDLQRPYNLTGGGTVAGMPEMFGMLRPDEYLSGVIPHALNMVSIGGQLSTAATGIASHTQCCGNWATYLMPFGTKIRLKPTFNSSGYPASCAPLITQMKTYGLIYSDGGANDIVPQFSSVWPTDCASYMYMNFAFSPANFDVVQQANTNIVCMGGGTNCPNTLPVGSPPVITGFTATPANVTLGQSVTLHWSVSGVVDLDGNPIPMRNISFGKNNKLGPGWIDGPAHGESLLITPEETGTYVYQLMVQNRFGRTTAQVTITVTK